MSLDFELGKIIDSLNLTTPEALSPDEPLVDRNWNNVVNSIKSLTEAVNLIRRLPPAVPPVGMAYIRFPGMPEPHIRFPATQKNQWKAIHELYPDCFFRLKGNEKDKKNIASVFKTDSEQVTFDTGVGQDGGGQIDTMQNHSHNYFAVDSKHQTAGGSANYFYSTGRPNSSGGVNSARVSSETRPKNITIELYIFIEA